MIQKKTLKNQITKKTIEITEEHVQEFNRFDLLLKSIFKEYSRSFIQDLFKNNNVQVSKESPIKNFKTELKRVPPVGALIDINIPVHKTGELKSEKIALNILYEDDDIIIINKAAGMVTHPAPGNESGTLINAMLHYYPKIKSVGESDRPGLVHRLDKGTSGALIMAKNNKSYNCLVEKFSNHDLKRVYHAITVGNSKLLTGKLESTIGRDPHFRQKMKAHVDSDKMAITFFRTLQSCEFLNHLELTLHTGRTHQIRVHLSQILHTPVLNDELYGNRKNDLVRLRANSKTSHIYDIIKNNNYEHPILHAKTLGLNHPITNEYIEVHAPSPQIIANIFNSLY